MIVDPHVDVGTPRPVRRTSAIGGEIDQGRQHAAWV